MALSKHSENRDATQYPHSAADRAFSGNEQGELLNDEIVEGKEKYLGDIANIEDVRGNGGEPVDERSVSIEPNAGNQSHAPSEEKSGLDNQEGVSGL